MKELASLHDKHLNRPTLDDSSEEERAIEITTQEITQVQSALGPKPTLWHIFNSLGWGSGLLWAKDLFCDQCWSKPEVLGSALNFPMNLNLPDLSLTCLIFYLEQDWEINQIKSTVISEKSLLQMSILRLAVQLIIMKQMSLVRGSCVTLPPC